LAAVTTALVVAAAGCSSKEDRGQNNGQASWSAGTNEIQIGLVAPMTGAFAVLGVSQQNSMQVVVDQINAAGGIGGAKLTIVTRDVGLDPAKAVAHVLNMPQVPADQRLNLLRRE